MAAATKKHGSNVKSSLQVVVSSVAVGVTWILLWILLYKLLKVMSRLTAMEEVVHIEKISLQSIRLLLLEMTFGPLTMLAFAMVFILIPAFLGWWAARLQRERFSTGQRAVLLTIALAVPVGIVAWLLCIAFRSASWSALACMIGKGQHGWGVFDFLAPFFLLFWVSAKLWTKQLIRTKEN